MVSVIKPFLFLLTAFSAGIAFSSGIAQAEEYLSLADFYAQAFSAEAVDNAEIKTLWLKKEDKAEAEKIFAHPYAGLRVRYRIQGETTAWVMDEIGKEKPITIGVIIDGHKIRQVSVLAFNESRGWEIKYPFFTDQFRGLSLQDDNHLSDHIDGITGATLSVNAVRAVSRWALYLNRQVNTSATTNLAHE
tara:strand:+ start:143 stop:712 length:570 start_codon:yes stop_codon:yes gene_type:complete